MSSDDIISLLSTSWSANLSFRSLNCSSNLNWNNSASFLSHFDCPVFLESILRFSFQVSLFCLYFLFLTGSKGEFYEGCTFDSFTSMMTYFIFAIAAFKFFRDINVGTIGPRMIVKSRTVFAVTQEPYVTTLHTCLTVNCSIAWTIRLLSVWPDRLGRNRSVRGLWVSDF